MKRIENQRQMAYHAETVEGKSGMMKSALWRLMTITGLSSLVLIGGCGGKSGNHSNGKAAGEPGPGGFTSAGATNEPRGSGGTQGRSGGGGRENRAAGAGFGSGAEPPASSGSGGSGEAVGGSNSGGRETNAGLAGSGAAGGEASVPAPGVGGSADSSGATHAGGAQETPAGTSGISLGETGGGSAAAAGGGASSGGGMAGTGGAAGTATSAGGPHLEGPCFSDVDCDQMRCDGTSGTCVECVHPGDCGVAANCLDHRCENAGVCSNGDDCPSTEPVCDPTWRVCVECVNSTDCAAGNDCTNGRCVPFDTCSSSLQCSSGVCSGGQCVECGADADCGDGFRCSSQECLPAPECLSDVDCRDLVMLCDPAVGRCVQCLGHSDCGERFYCSDRRCVPDLCPSDAVVCQDNAVATCNAVGDGVARLEPCEGEEQCTRREGGAQCLLGGTCGPVRQLDVIWSLWEVGDEIQEYGDVIAHVHSQLADHGVSPHTILLSNHHEPEMLCAAGNGVCVPPPVGSETCPGSTEDFIHIASVDTYTRGPFDRIVTTYDDWKEHLRADALPVVVVLNNSSERSREISNEDFMARLSALQPPLVDPRLVGIVCAAVDCDGPAVVCDPNPPTARCQDTQQYLDLASALSGSIIDFCTTLPEAAKSAVLDELLRIAVPPGC